MEMGLQIPGRLGDSGADDERQLQLVEGFEIGPGQHPGIGGHHQRRTHQVVALQEAVMIGTIVVVSAVLPSKQPISKGNPVRSTSSPTTI